MRKYLVLATGAAVAVALCGLAAVAQPYGPGMRGCYAQGYGMMGPGYGHGWMMGPGMMGGGYGPGYGMMNGYGPGMMYGHGYSAIKAT